MKRTRSPCTWSMAALLVSACTADSTDLSAVRDPAAQTDAVPLASVARPDGWDEASHGNDAAPDYDRLFADDRVQRLDLSIEPSVHTAMFEDLKQRLGGGGVPSAAVTACTGRVAKDPCSFLDVKGTCTSNGRQLSCLGEDQVGAVDSVPGDPVMVPVTVRYDGKVWNHVGMRFKGNSSLFSPFRSGGRKLPMRLDFDKFEDEHPEIKNQHFYGFSKMTFSSGYSDAALIREKLASDLLRDAGLVVARTAFYRLFVDVGSGPEYWGLYTMVEDPADQLISANFPDDSGNLYKPDGPGSDFVRFDVRGFEKKSNEKEADFSDVRAVFDVLHAPRDDAAAWRTKLEAVFDVDTFLQNTAVGRAIDHWDAYGQLSHNYYLYGDPTENGRLVWISWDHNMTWTSTRGRTPVIPTANSRWPLLRNLLADPVYMARYREMLAEFAGGLYAKSEFDARASKLHALIAPYVVGPEGEKAPYTFVRNDASFQNALPALLAIADARRVAIGQALAPPATPTPPAATPTPPEAPAPSATPEAPATPAEETTTAPALAADP